MAHILVVEDYTVTQRLLSHMLRARGHTITPAFNGVEALDKLTDDTFDLLIIDIAMPMMDGLTLLRHLRADERYRALPIIVLTASADDADRRMAQADGASTFLTKPVSSNELAEAVNVLLQS
jgi:CheY-like chemotaxis protein